MKFRRMRFWAKMSYIYWVACVLSLDDFLGDYGYACAWICEDLNKAECLVLHVDFSSVGLDELRVRSGIKVW